MKILVLLFANLVAAMGITVIVPVLSIAGDIFNVDQSDSMWLMTGFMLTYASFMPIFGKISDHFGRKKTFLLANSIFAAGLLLSAFSRNFHVVVLGRIIQGFGSGGILPVANAMIVEMMPKDSEKALSLVNMTYGLGMILGVNLGGIIYEQLGVSAMMYVPAISSLVLTIIGLIFLEETLETAERSNIDFLGSLLFAFTLVFFILALKYAGVGSKDYVLYSVLSVASFLAFVAVELRVEEPAIDLGMFKNPVFTLYNTLAIFFGVSMFISVTFMAPFVQILLGFDVAESVYMIDPFALIMAIFIAIGGSISRKLGPRLVMVLSAGVTTLALFIFSKHVESALSFLVLSAFVGVGLGLSMTPMNQIVMEEGGRERKGLSAGIVSVMRSVGGVVGPTLAGFIFARTDFSSIFALDNIIEAYRKVYSVAAWSAAVMFVLSLVGISFKRSKEEVASYEG